MRNKRPLVGVALLFCAGIFVGSLTDIPLKWSGVATGFFALGFFGLYRTRFHGWMFYPLPFLAGLFAYQHSLQVHSPIDLRNLIGDQPQHVVLRGVVCDWPETRWKQTPRGEFGRTSLTMHVEEIRRGMERESATGDVLVHFEELGEPAAIAYGDEVELDGSIELPPIARNPGQFDYRRYLARQGVYYQFRLGGTDELKILRSRQGNPIMQIAADANEYFKQCLARGIEDESEMVGLLWAIVLGFRPGLTNELSEPFMRTGTLHVFAVSGFHISLIALILVGGLRLCRLSRTASGLGSIPLLLIYTLITGAPPSAVRSFIMASVVMIGYALLRPTDIFNSLAAAAIAVLVWNPQQLFDAGFQLSFFVVLNIALFTLRVHDRLLRWAKPDPFLPRDVVPKWRRWLFYPLSKVLLFCSVSFAAVVGSAPLIANYFHLVTPVALLSNLLIVPLSGGVIGLGFFSMVTGGFLPAITELFNNANYLLLSITVRLTEWLARVPLGSFYIGAPPWPLLLAYYAMIGAMLSGWAWQTNRRAVFTAFATAAVITATVSWYLLPRPATVTVLDVGGGQAVVLDQPGRNDLLIDGGRRSHGQWVLHPLLRQRGIGNLKAIILTVNDIDHAGGLIPIVQRINFERFYKSAFKSRSKEYRELANLLEGDPRHQTLTAGMEIELSRSGAINTLHPPAQSSFVTADDNSLVLQIHCDDVRLLFKSEIGESVERALLASGADLRSHILITGQHPKETCCIDAFLDRVQPGVVIMNAGSFPTHAYPRPEITERIKRRGIKLYRTDECGGLVITLTRGAYAIEPTIPPP